MLTKQTQLAEAMTHNPMQSTLWNGCKTLTKGHYNLIKKKTLKQLNSSGMAKIELCNIYAEK